MSKCGVCGDAGKVVKLIDGERVSVPCPECGGYAEALIKKSKIPKIHAGSTLEGFIAQNSELRNAVESCIAFPGGARWLLLSGPTGVGKTHLMVGIIKKACTSGFRAAYISCEDLFFEGRMHASGSQSNFVGLSHLARTVPLLCLDELGCGRGTDFEVGIIQEVINARYNSDLHTVFATNYRVGTGTEGSLEGSGKIGNHSLSRVLGQSLIVNIDSDDWRTS